MKELRLLVRDNALSKKLDLLLEEFKTMNTYVSNTQQQLLRQIATSVNQTSVVMEAVVIQVPFFGKSIRTLGPPLPLFEGDSASAGSSIVFCEEPLPLPFESLGGHPGT